jgi:hypothetical protein
MPDEKFKQDISSRVGIQGMGMRAWNEFIKKEARVEAQTCFFVAVQRNVHGE